jgi:hypothetical protein
VVPPHSPFVLGFILPTTMIPPGITGAPGAADEVLDLAEAGLELLAEALKLDDEVLKPENEALSVVDEGLELLARVLESDDGVGIGVLAGGGIAVVKEVGICGLSGGGIMVVDEAETCRLSGGGASLDGIDIGGMLGGGTAFTAPIPQLPNAERHPRPQ